MNNWPVKKLGEVAEYINGFAFKPTEWESKGLPIIRIQNLNDPTAKFNYYLKPIDRKFIVEDGDLLISWSASLDVYIWDRERAVLNQHIFKVIPNGKIIDKKFFFYTIKKVLQNLIDETHGSTMKHITKKKFEAIEIPVPGIEEQKRIVAKLEKILAKIEQAWTLRQESFNDTNLVLKSASAKTFSDKKFAKKKVKEVVTTETRRNTDKELPYIGMEDVESDTGILLVSPRSKSVKSTTFYFDNSHVLYGKLRPYLNKVFLPDFNGHCTTEFIPLKPKQDLKREFLALWLRSPNAVERLSGRTTGTRMPRADMNLLMDLEIPVPDLREQEKIVAYLDGLNEKVQALQKLQQEQLQELDALQQSILHQAFQGRI